MKINEKIAEIKKKIHKLNYKIDILHAKGLKVDHQLKINECNELKIILEFLENNQKDLNGCNFY